VKELRGGRRRRKKKLRDRGIGREDGMGKGVGDRCSET